MIADLGAFSADDRTGSESFSFRRMRCDGCGAQITEVSPAWRR